MGKRENDILLIRKYLDGQLDAKEMHQLERRALDDPFLMDALEGYGAAGGYRDDPLDELSARLHKRIEPAKARVLPLRTIGIAASILIVCSAGIWWFSSDRTTGTSNQPPSVKTVRSLRDALAAKKQLQATAIASDSANNHRKPMLTNREVIVAKSGLYEKPAVAADESVAIPPTVSQVKSAAPLAQAKINDTSAADTTPLNEMIVMEYKSSKKTDTSLLARKAKLVPAAANPPAQLLQARVAGVNVYSNGQSPAERSKMITQGYLSNLPADQILTNQIFEGRVVGKDDGKPIIGASVMVAGTNKTTATDVDGHFKIKADSSHSSLVVAGIGYQTRMVSGNNRDSVKDIALEPNSSSLSEVVVTGYTSANKDEAVADVVSAHPQQGWGLYRKYLKKNATSTDGAEGIVKLTFTVDKYGSIMQIKVTKGLSESADKKAVDLVKNGPDWVGNSDKKPEEIHLRIRFSK